MAELSAPQTPSRARPWLLLGAWVCAAVALAQLIAWANRWYVAGMFMRSSTGDADAAWAYQILDRAMQALVAGVAMALVAAALAFAARRTRDGSPRRT